MRADMTSEQREFAAYVRQALAVRFSPDHLRSSWQSPNHIEPIWDALGELGIVGMLVPARAGGAGAETIDIALVLEELGRAAIAAPVEGTIVAALLLRERDEPEATKYLEAISRGDLIVSMATESGLVPHGASADVILRANGEFVELLENSQVQLSPFDSVDPGSALARLDSHEPGWSIGTASMFEVTASWVSALLLVGLADRLVDMARAHVVTRKQFGRFIGEFQAIKHRLADTAVALEAARGLAWHAAYCAAHDLDQLPMAASTAKSAANSAARIARAAALQVHGGLGFTWEHDLHLYIQRTRVLESSFGTTRALRTAVGRSWLDNLSKEIAHDKVQ